MASWKRIGIVSAIGLAVFIMIAVPYFVMFSYKINVLGTALETWPRQPSCEVKKIDFQTDGESHTTMITLKYGTTLCFTTETIGHDTFGLHEGELVECMVNPQSQYSCEVVSVWEEGLEGHKQALMYGMVLFVVVGAVSWLFFVLLQFARPESATERKLKQGYEALGAEQRDIVLTVSLPPPVEKAVKDFIVDYKHDELEENKEVEDKLNKRQRTKKDVDDFYLMENGQDMDDLTQQQPTELDVVREVSRWDWRESTVCVACRAIGGVIILFAFGITYVLMCAVVVDPYEWAPVSTVMFFCIATGLLFTGVGGFVSCAISSLRRRDAGYFIITDNFLLTVVVKRAVDCGGDSLPPITVTGTLRQEAKTVEFPTNTQTKTSFQYGDTHLFTGLPSDDIKDMLARHNIRFVVRS